MLFVIMMRCVLGKRCLLVHHNNMIIGIGCDMVDIRRIEALIKRKGERALARLFTADERTYCDAASHDRRMTRYANRFAAKEAAVKALSAYSVLHHWHDVSVVHAAHGGPELLLAPHVVNALAQQLSGRVACHVSLSDEYPYSIAYAVLSVIK